MPTLEWIGKKAVLNHHNEIPYRLLKCDPKLSVGQPGSGNLLVQGDNLEALKALLPYYAGQVKCIYIDPPYNTGNEGWIYNDAVNSPEMKAWLGKAVGKESEDLSRHDKWLCMMYPRVALLKQFLREDGVLFMSVDGNEHRHAELLLDELLGSANRLETLIWKKSYGGGAKSKHIVNLHEYILCFAKNKILVPFLEMPPSEGVLKYYKYKDRQHEERGPYRFQPLATNSMDSRPNLKFAIHYKGEEIWPEKQWQWSRERVDLALSRDELSIEKRKGKWVVNYKQYLRDEEGEERTTKPYSIIEGIYTQKGTNEIKDMFGDGKTFSFPKPSGLIQHLLHFATEPDSLVLDSFTGSGTTGHAVLALNKADGGNRRCILVEIDPTIAQTITAQRLKRVIEGYHPSGEKKKEKVEGLGGGFRYCELGPALFDAQGRIGDEVSFLDLARHVFFTETGEPLPKENRSRSPLIGFANGLAVYLLYNGILKDKAPGGGNVLTGNILEHLPPHGGPKVIFGTACRLSAKRLKAKGITFRQIPYDVKVR